MGFLWIKDSLKQNLKNDFNELIFLFIVRAPFLFFLSDTIQALTSSVDKRTKSLLNSFLEKNINDFMSLQ
tara:strand:+ start:181 stop:390 length:210 start_codon:yes stop_codon:yes gene_type:complete